MQYGSYIKGQGHFIRTLKHSCENLEIKCSGHFKFVFQNIYTNSSSFCTTWFVY